MTTWVVPTLPYYGNQLRRDWTSCGTILMMVWLLEVEIG